MGELRSRASLQAVDRLKGEICVDLSCNLILLILLIFDGKEGKCGIPILTWLIGFFIILAFKTILKGFTIFFIEANP